MRTPTIFVMLLLVIASTTADKEAPPGTVPTIAPTKPTEKPPIDQVPRNGTFEGERGPDVKEGGGIDNGSGTVEEGSEQEQPVGNEGGNAGGNPAEASEEASSITSGVGSIGGLAAIVSVLTYLF